MTYKTFVDQLAEAHSSFKITSEPTVLYNCIAWAFKETHRRWEPSLDEEASFQQHAYWPAGVPHEMHLDAWKQLLQSRGYYDCNLDDSYEIGFEKIAIYVKGGDATHLARQLENGSWTSKLGDKNDVSHALGDLESKYGDVEFIGKKQLD